VNNLVEGDDDDSVNLSVQVPSSFEVGDALRLVIDLRRTGDGSGLYFSNRETGRPWFDLTYSLCLGGECKTHLPLVLKNYRPPISCPHGQALILNGDFEAGYPPTPWIEYSAADYQLVYEGAAGAHTGDWHAFLAGYPNADDRIYQFFVLPEASTGATLDYYFQLGTYDNDPPPHHFLYVWLKTGSGQNIILLDEMDNTDQQDVWYHRIIHVKGLSSKAGQTLRLSFEAETDNSSRSAFHVDDVNFKVNCNLGGAPPTAGVLVERSTSIEEPAQQPAPVEKSRP
jgi:hypothetical protein